VSNERVQVLALAEQAAAAAFVAASEQLETDWRCRANQDRLLEAAERYRRAKRALAKAVSCRRARGPRPHCQRLKLDQRFVVITSTMTTATAIPANSARAKLQVTPAPPARSAQSARPAPCWRTSHNHQRGAAYTLPA
jgi:hypothetical protein